MFRHLREEEIESLSLEMAGSSTSTRRQPSVLEELAATPQARASTAAGGIEYAREVLERAVGATALEEIIGRLSSSSSAGRSSSCVARRPSSS